LLAPCLFAQEAATAAVYQVATQSSTIITFFQLTSGSLPKLYFLTLCFTSSNVF
jgi:hypothetical protein